MWILLPGELREFCMRNRLQKMQASLLGSDLAVCFEGRPQKQGNHRHSTYSTEAQQFMYSMYSNALHYCHK